MKFHAEQTFKDLHPELASLLSELRLRRGFRADAYVDGKVGLLNGYLHRSGLKSCVVAVSGGIDSAVVLALAVEASRCEGSPLERIVPVSLPIFRQEYTSNQDQSKSRSEELMAWLGLPSHVIDLTRAFSEIKEAVDSGLGMVGEGWASGQLVSYLRTPAIYYVTSLLSQSGLPAVVCGTTNRDEGAYLGFFSKASDGMVDIQLISDLHKSEVRSVAALLGIPKSIIGAVPTGDMFDGRVDEDVFGCSYDFVELFLLLRSLGDGVSARELVGRLGKEAREQFDVLNSRVESLHLYNLHKYAVGSPAVHLDLIEAGVPGGWPGGRQGR